MFVRKLVEKASRKHTGGPGINGLRAEDVNPRLAFHYGVPSDSSVMAYEPMQAILAIATRNGQIKLFGRDNTQALLQSAEAVPTKFLQFIENQGILLNVTSQSHIEVWDIVKMQLCSVHIFNDEITSFAVVKQSSYMYVGDCLGNITVLKLDHAVQHLVQMQYRIPFSESHGATEAGSHTSVMYMLLQPTAESKRVLIIFRDGHICLWGMQESKVIFTAGGNMQHSSNNEPKFVVSACWTCAFGSRVVVGYNTGDIFLWAIPVISDEKTASMSNKKELYAAPNVPLLKLNLGYKTDKVPIVSLKWSAGDGRNTRLYVNGFSDLGSSCSFQVIILNENSESRTIKLVLPLTEACLAMEVISCFNDRNKHKQNALVLLLKSGHLCLYDDSEIENYLLQCQSKSSPTLPRQLMVKLQFGDSSITVAKLYTGNSSPSSQMDEEHIMLASKYPYFLSISMKERGGNHFSATCFNGFSKTRSLYVTGHHDGAINIWDASCPLLLLILSIKQQNEDGSSCSGIPVTSLSLDVSSQILVSGDQNGLVRIIMFKKEQLASENIFTFLQGKQGGNYTVRSIKVDGSITSLNLNSDLKRLAVGTHKGSVAVVDMEGITIVYQIQVPSQQCTGIISLQFQNYGQNGTEKNVLLVGSGDSSVLALEEDTGNAFSTSAVHAKKPSRALLMQILDASPGAWKSDFQDISKDTTTKQSLLLLCSENAVRLYSLSHVIQGLKKVYGKKKLSGTCCHASVIYGPSLEVGLVLIFASGKIEIRSLPDLTLLKEVLLRGFANSISEPHTNAKSVLCTSADGGLVAVNGDQEILFFSFLPQKDTYSRHLEHISQVYKKDVVSPQEGQSSLMNGHKEKKKGIFSMVINDLKGNKTKHSEEINAKDSSASICDELSAIFSTVNFPLDAEGQNSLVENNENAELDIDDIDLEDAAEKQKRPNFAVLNKQKIGKKLQALKGKLKPKAEEKVDSQKNKHEEEKITSEVDQIKKKYGYTVNNELDVAKMAESKLSENIQKLQAIGLRTSEMQNTAQSFSSMANELLRSVQHDKSS